MRLIDECKEEEDRLAVINNEEDDDVKEQLENQRRMTENQLTRFDQLEAVMGDVDTMTAKAK